MNLIYFTLGSNQKYFDLLKLNINSLDRFYDENIELLIITDNFLKNKIQRELRTKFKINFIISQINSISQSSYNKLKIYQYGEINKFEKIIFCDADILWNDSPNLIFDKISNDKIHVSNDDDFMFKNYWGGSLLTSDEIKEIKENNIFGISCGFFGFNVSLSSIFKEIEDFLLKNINVMNTCFEQPYFNTFLFRNKLYKNDLNEFITNKGYNLTSSDKVVVHFAGGPGNYEIKFKKMMLFKLKQI